MGRAYAADECCGLLRSRTVSSSSISLPSIHARQLRLYADQSSSWCYTRADSDRYGHALCIHIDAALYPRLCLWYVIPASVPNQLR